VHDLGLGVAAVVVFGVGAMWLASRLRIPSILLLLPTGVLVGPVLQIVDPEELLGELRFPAISLAVGVLLFEGGLGLQWDRVREGRAVVLRLVTVGVLTTWAVAAVAVGLLFDVPWSIAVLIGAVLTVSGPTVVQPLLRLARPRPPSAPILRWEGILIDPVGATLAIVVLDAIIGQQGPVEGALRVVTTAGVGAAAGVIGAAVLVQALRKQWIPDHLQNPVTLMLVVGAFAGANLLRPEAGLFATTVMGVAVANQSLVEVRHINEFEENLGMLILAALFVLLGSGVVLSELQDVALPSLVLIAVLVLVARPLAVFVSTVGTGVPRNHRRFVAAMAPRGIVAAAVASVFAIELEEAGVEARLMVPITFMVILGTVAVYGLSATGVAKWLKVAHAEPKGLAIVGVHSWVLDLADELLRLDVPVLLVTTDREEVDEATSRGVLVFSGRLDSEDLPLALDGLGIHQALAVSRAAELNGFGIGRLVEALGRANVFHLPPQDDRAGGSATAVIGRRPFGRDATQMVIEDRLVAGAAIRTVIGSDYPPRIASGQPGQTLPLCLVDSAGRPNLVSGSIRPGPTDHVVVLTDMLSTDVEATHDESSSDLEALDDGTETEGGSGPLSERGA